MIGPSSWLDVAPHCWHRTSRIWAIFNLLRSTCSRVWRSVIRRRGSSSCSGVCPMSSGLAPSLHGVSDMAAGLGKVVVNRAMSVDGFIAGPDNAMDWIFEYMREDPFPEVMAATGAMLVGRGTYEVAKRMPEGGHRLRRGAGVRSHASASGRAAATGSPSSAATSRRRSPRRGLSRARRPGDPRRGPGRSVPTARSRRRGPGVCLAGADRRRCALLDLGPRQDRPRTVQQHPVRPRDHAPLPRTEP